MAPNQQPLDTVDDALKGVIQDLYEIQSSTHGYLGPETQQVLIRKIQALTSSLSHLVQTSSSIPVQIPPEIIDYVETGRNPDIYTREFVELVQRQNAILKAKSDALAAFRDVLGDEIAAAWPELRGYVKSGRDDKSTGEGGNITNGGVGRKEGKKENGV